MNRRDFAVGSAGTVLSSLSLPLWAQGTAADGKGYNVVPQPVPVPPGKVDVVEFFGYWCPHCNAFEPQLDAWARKLPAAQVNFRRVAVAFNAAHEPLQRLYFALESLDMVEAMHRKVFAALHVQKIRLDNDADIGAWLKANVASGADSTKVMDAMKSFSVATKSRQTRQLASDYKIEGVPTLGIQGRYTTSPSIAGTPERALAVADQLIAQSRKA